MQLRVTANGVKTFSVYRRTQGGGPERITMGRFGDLTVDQPRRRAKDINGDIAHGKNPADIKRQRKEEQTFSELFEVYMERHAKPKKKSWNGDQSQYDLYLEKPLGKKRLSDITRAHVAMIHSSITKAGHPTTANRVKALVSGVFGWATSAGLWDVNPASGIKLNLERSRDRFMRGNELARFFQALADEPNHTMRDYLLLSLLTGARRSNVMAMRWQDIDFEQAEWRIVETKNGEPQTVTLSPEALEILRARKPLEPALFVFPGVGRTGRITEPKTAWRRVLNRAGITDLRIHDLRRTLGSWQARMGTSLPVIGKSLNHKNSSTTAVYARLDLDPVRDSVNRATNAMLVAAGAKEPADVLPLEKLKKNSNKEYRDRVPHDDDQPGLPRRRHRPCAGRVDEREDSRSHHRRIPDASPLTERDRNACLDQATDNGVASQLQRMRLAM